MPAQQRPRLSALLRRLFGDERGNVAVITALGLPALLGAVGLGTEVASWYGVQRGLQNAADSAALAAATAADDHYAEEARAVAARYGYVNGQGNVVVQALDNQACPDGTATCYKVTIIRTTPLLLAQLAGFRGEARVAGAPAKRISATAVAIQANTPRAYCLVALASGAATGLRTNGAPKADLSGCNVMSNANANCNGHNLKVDHGDAAGTNDNCGVARASHVEKLKDPYAARASNIEKPSCGSYPQLPAKKKDAELPPSNQLSGFVSWSDVVGKCGDIQLTGDLTVDTPSDGAVLVINNGALDLNGHTIRTTNGSGLTVVFTGSGTGYHHAPTGDGTIDIAAPKTGDWAGIALYQDPALTDGVDISAAGNSPTWNITGLVYLPKAAVTFSGAVNKSSNGKSCFVLMANTVLVNGAGSILAQGECADAGLEMPTTKVAQRGKLVL